MKELTTYLIEIMLEIFFLHLLLFRMICDHYKTVLNNYSYIVAVKQLQH